MKIAVVRNFSAFFLFITAFEVNAGDLSNDVRKGNHSPSAGESNYVELGLSLGAYTSSDYGLPDGNREGDVHGLASVDFNFHLQYKGFFIESFNQSLEKFTVGYNFYNNDKWSLDLVSGIAHEEINGEDHKDLRGIKRRKESGVIGLRTTGYYEDYIAQVHLLTGGAESDSNFGIISAKLAHHWQVKNWNFHAIAGATYSSKEFGDYYYSIEKQDANEKFPEFEAGAGLTSVIELGVTYPISQAWVFRGLVRHVSLEKQWADSPLVVSRGRSLFLTSVAYVF